MYTPQNIILSIGCAFVVLGFIIGSFNLLGAFIRRVPSPFRMLSLAIVSAIFMLLVSFIVVFSASMIGVYCGAAELSNFFIEVIS